MIELYVFVHIARQSTKLTSPSLVHHPPGGTDDGNQHQPSQDARAGAICRCDRVRIDLWLRVTFTTSAGGIVSLTGATRGIRHWGSNLGDEVRLENLQGTHLLADALAAVPAALRPLETAARALVATGTGLRCSHRGGSKFRNDLVVREGRHLCSGCHPSRQVRLERPLIDLAGVDGFAGPLVHDVLLGEENIYGVQNTLSSVFPFRIAVCLWQSVAVRKRQDCRDIRSCTY